MPSAAAVVVTAETANATSAFLSAMSRSDEMITASGVVAARGASTEPAPV